MLDFCVFIDDVGIPGRGSFGDHIETVCAVLNRFENAGLTISAEKTVFGCSQVVYPGSLVD